MMGENLHITLLGQFCITHNNAVISKLNSGRLQELLAWLLLHSDAPQSRQSLSFIFWPNSTEKQARTNLRNVLYQLREALPDENKYILADFKTLRWNPESSYVVDVDELEELISEAEQAKRKSDTDTQLSALKHAIQIYSGPLLPDCYSNWIEGPRNNLRRIYLDGLANLIDLLEKKRDYDSAIRYAQVWTKEESFNEPSWRKLIQLHAKNNDRARALQAYQSFVKILKDELNVEPTQETEKLVKRLLSNYRSSRLTG